MRRFEMLVLTCRPLFVAVLCGAAAFAASAWGQDEPARNEKLRVAREIMERVRYCALVTVDADGQPRTRTVLPFVPEGDMAVWIATKPGTRKLEQIAAHPRVTLYYADEKGASYVSLMGVATIRDDAAAKREHRHPDVDAFWPDYPDGYTLIEVAPVWLEVLGPGVDPDEVTWRPQEVRFPAG